MTKSWCMFQKKLLKIFTPIFVFFLPFFVHAQVRAPKFDNPLGAGSTVFTILTRVINALLGFIGILAMLALVWGAIMIITAFGDDKKITTAKGIIFWSIAGVALAIVSYAIINTIRKVFGIV